LENLVALGIQELTFEEQCALLGGEGIAEDLGRVLGWFTGALGAVHHSYHEVLDDVRYGFWEGYHEARGA
jgi:hypothetical protein